MRIEEKNMFAHYFIFIFFAGENYSLKILIQLQILKENLFIFQFNK